MSTYIVHSCGYHNCPEFRTLAEARQHLSVLVKESLESARRRWKRASKIKLDVDNYAIHAICDTQSPMWAQHYIAKY